jgi:hypothetical protein
MASKPKWVVSVEDERDSERSFKRVFGSEVGAYKFAAEVIVAEIVGMLDGMEFGPEDVEYLNEIVKSAKGPELRDLANAVDEYAAEDLGPYNVKVSVEAAY